MVPYNSYSGPKPPAIGDPAANFLWIGVMNDFIVFDRGGDSFQAGPANWGGTITQFEWNGSAWEQGGGDPDQATVTEPEGPTDCESPTPTPLASSTPGPCETPTQRRWNQRPWNRRRSNPHPNRAPRQLPLHANADTCADADTRPLRDTDAATQSGGANSGGTHTGALRFPHTTTNARTHPNARPLRDAHPAAYARGANPRRTHAGTLRFPHTSANARTDSNAWSLRNTHPTAYPRGADTGGTHPGALRLSYTATNAGAYSDTRSLRDTNPRADAG